MEIPQIHASGSADGRRLGIKHVRGEIAFCVCPTVFALGPRTTCLSWRHFFDRAIGVMAMSCIYTARECSSSH